MIQLKKLRSIVGYTVAIIYGVILYFEYFVENSEEFIAPLKIAGPILLIILSALMIYIGRKEK